MGQKLLDYIISKNNLSGSIPPAPQGLKNLKESIEGLPFELLSPSISGIFGQLQQQLQQLIQSMGGIQNMGGQGIQQVLGQIQNGTISVDQIIETFGGVTAMTAGLSGYLPAELSQAITQLAGSQAANTGG
jgi:phage-related protein